MSITVPDPDDMGAEDADSELLSRCAQGDADALVELYRRYGVLLHRYLARWMGLRSPDIDDALQQVFVVAWTRADSFRPRSGSGAEVRSWLYGISTNVIREHRRRNTTRLRALQRLSELPLLRAPSLDEVVSQRQLAQRAIDALESLTDSEREAYLLCDVEGLAGVEAARALDCGPVRSGGGCTRPENDYERSLRKRTTMSGDHPADEASARLDALTSLLKQGVPMPAPASQERGATRLRAAVASVPRAHRRPRNDGRKVAAACALLVAFVLGWWSGQRAPPQRPRAEAVSQAPRRASSQPLRAAPSVERTTSASEPAAETSSTPARTTGRSVRMEDSPAPSIPTRAPRTDKPSVAVQGANAFRLLAAGRYEAAAVAFRRTAEVGPVPIRPDAAYYAAVAAARAGRRAEAIEGFDEFTQRYPKHPQFHAAHVARGWLLLKAGRSESARQAFEIGVTARDARIVAAAKNGLSRARGQDSRDH